MNILLDGISGVGKTYLGEKLAERLGIRFYEFLPDSETNSESALHSYAIQRQAKTDMTIIEGSYIMSEIVKMYMYENGMIDFEQILKMKSIDTSKVKPFFVIFITDDRDKIAKRVKSRGRPYEFRPDLKNLESLNDYIISNYPAFYNKHNVIYKVFSRMGMTEKETLDSLTDLVYNIIKEYM